MHHTRRQYSKTEIQAYLTPKGMQNSRYTVLWPEWSTSFAWYGWLWATASKAMVIVLLPLSQSLGWDFCFHTHHWALISLGYRNPLCYPTKANTFPKFLIPGCSRKKSAKGTAGFRNRVQNSALEIKSLGPGASMQSINTPKNKIWK